MGSDFRAISISTAACFSVASNEESVLAWGRHLVGHLLRDPDVVGWKDLPYFPGPFASDRDRPSSCAQGVVFVVVVIVGDAVVVVEGHRLGQVSQGSLRGEVVAELLGDFIS